MCKKRALQSHLVPPSVGENFEQRPAGSAERRPTNSRARSGKFVGRALSPAVWETASGLRRGRAYYSERSACPTNGLLHSERPREVATQFGWVAQLAEQRTENLVFYSGTQIVHFDGTRTVATECGHFRESYRQHDVNKSERIAASIS